MRGQIIEVFHIQEVQDGQLYGTKYIATPHEELEPVSLGPITLGDRIIKRVRVVTRVGVDGPFLEFNPQQPVTKPHIIWIIGRI
jgi:hypothetical protein